MKPEWLWDKDISLEEIQQILKDPRNERFLNMAALLLSRSNAPKEVFAQYLDRKDFVKNWARIKRQMRKDAWNDPRIIFWQAVYEKLVAEFKQKGVSLRPGKEEKAVDELCRQIAEKVKAYRQEMGWTQSKLAERLGISQQVISRIESGRENVRVLTLEKIFPGMQPVTELRRTWIKGKFYH